MSRVRTYVFSIIGAAAMTVAAFAHSPLASSSPAKMTVIAELPPELVLTFKGKIRLTRVFASLAGGDRQELDLSGHTGFENRISLPLVSLGVGEYLIEWRGLGEDGHAMRGDFSFTLK